MIAGFDRYYQIAKCFRDEDLRANRQPEFTQIDMEMSYADCEDVMGVAEGLIREVFDKLIGAASIAELATSATNGSPPYVSKPKTIASGNLSGLMLASA